MKRIKHLLYGLILLCVVTLTTGCFDKEAKTATDFVDSMSSSGYAVTDALDQADVTLISGYKIASNTKKGIQVEFIVFKTEEHAKASFNKNVEKFEGTVESTSVKTESHMGNNEKYTLSANNRYMVVSRIENTLIYIDTNVDNKETIKKLLDNFGY